VSRGVNRISAPFSQLVIAHAAGLRLEYVGEEIPNLVKPLTMNNLRAVFWIHSSQYFPVAAQPHEQPQVVKLKKYFSGQHAIIRRCKLKLITR
jgi:hypothetical protein